MGNKLLRSIGFVLLIVVVVNGQNSMIPDKDIDSTIVFLEDSIRVQQLVNRLKQIRNAQIAAHADSGVKKELLPVNIFKTGSDLQRKVLDRIELVHLEIGGVFRRFETIKQGVSSEEIRQRLVSLLVLAGIVLSASILVSLLFWNTSSRFKKLSLKNDGIYKPVYSTLYHVFKHLAVWAGIITAGLGFELIPLNRDFSHLINNLMVAVLLYSLFSAFMNALFSPSHAELRIVRCSTQISLFIVRNSCTVMRFSLMIYVLHRITISHWSAIADASVALYKIILTFWIPAILYKSRNLFSGQLQNILNKMVFLPGPVRVISESIVNRTYLIVFVFLAVLTGISLLGYNDLYLYLLKSSGKTVAVFILVYLLVIVWGVIIKKNHQRIISQFAGTDEVRPYLEKNLKLVERLVYISIQAAAVFSLLQIWGVNLIELLRSKVPFVQAVIHCITIGVVAIFGIQGVRFVVDKFKKEASLRMLRSGNSNSFEVEKRVATLGGVIQKITIGSIVLFAVMMIMDELGFDIKAMLAGVGIMGIAVGFGAQNLVRDIISGLFVIFENRIRVGDVAIINGTGGLVEQVNLRTSVLRGVDGTIHVFPNGAITSLSNMTHEYSYYVFEIGVAYKEDTDRVVSVLNEIGIEIQNDPDFKDAILEPLEVNGIDAFKDSSIIIKARIKTLPIKQWFVGREMNRRIKKRFDELGIEMPFPHRTIYFGDTAVPPSLQKAGTVSNKTEIRNLILEILSERQQELT